MPFSFSKMDMRDVIVVILFALCNAGLTFGDREFKNLTENGRETDLCFPQQLDGVHWILNQRKDYGWGDDTHRNIIVLYLNALEGKISLTDWEKDLMVAQLNLQISKALLRNSSDIKSSLDQSDLALYIHALLLVGQNPRDFKGLDLVKKLEEIATTSYRAFPLSFLCLCNAGILQKRHLVRLQNYLKMAVNNSSHPSKLLETIALTVIAYGCAETQDLLTEDMKSALSAALFSLIQDQRPDGSFGNGFTTAIILQAMKIRKDDFTDEIRKARSYLQKLKPESIIEIYYTELALKETVFIKDVIDKLPTGTPHETLQQTETVKYSLKISTRPLAYETITLTVPKNTVMLDIMKRAAAYNPKFNFSYSLHNEKPYIYSISNISNNPEDSKFWKLYEEFPNYVTELKHPVSDFLVQDGRHYTFYYKNYFTKLA